MQDSQSCMFCRYRKARIAACCAAHGASAPRADAPDPAHTAPSPSLLPASPDRTVARPSPQEAPAFA